MKSARQYRQMAEESRQASKLTLSLVMSQRFLAQAGRYEMRAAEIERASQ